MQFYDALLVRRARPDAGQLAARDKIIVRRDFILELLYSVRRKSCTARCGGGSAPEGQVASEMRLCGPVNTVAFCGCYQLECA